MIKQSISEMSLEYIRNYYNVPAYTGKKVEYTSLAGKKYTGTIVGGKDAYIVLEFEENMLNGAYHPTWNINYLEK
jgi:hypothetical protein